MKILMLVIKALEDQEIPIVKIGTWNIMNLKNRWWPVNGISCKFRFANSNLHSAMKIAKNTTTFNVPALQTDLT